MSQQQWQKTVRKDGPSGLEILLKQVKQLAQHAERESKKCLDHAEALARDAQKRHGKHVG